VPARSMSGSIVLNMPDHLGRRGLLTGGAALLLGAAANSLPVPRDDRLLFQLIRNNSVMGSHRLDFNLSASGLAVTVNVLMALYFGPFRIFHYAHHAVETWDGNECVSVVSQTDHDGKRYQLVAKRDGMGWQVMGASGDVRAPSDALPATHWNRQMLRGPMINTENGDILRPKIADLGPEMVPAFDAAPIRAEHFALSGDVQMDTWYDGTNSWAGAAFKGADGSVIRYERA